MIKLATALIILSMPAFAIDSDKQKHFIVEAALCSATQMYTKTWWKTLLTGLTVGGLKEWHDSTQPGNKFSKGDMAANAIGCAAGIGYGNAVLYYDGNNINVRGKF